MLVEQLRGLGLPAAPVVVVHLQPADAAVYRITVTTLDQHSADVLTEIASYATAADDATERFRLDVRDHWNYSQAATVASGSIEMQRILLARTLLSAAS